MGLSQEERLFLELARKRGSITQAQAQVAKVKAATDGSSVVETLTTLGALSFEDADAIRKELVGLSFPCTRCGTQAYRAPGADVPVGTEAVCPSCAGKTQAEGVPEGANEATERHFDRDGTVGPELVVQAPPTLLAPGQVIGGCQVEEQIGQGGMSVVYRARHLAFQRAVAVKVLDKRLIARPGFVEQFLTEARALAGLDHPNVVRFYEAARDDTSGLHYLVMELLEGGSVQSAWEKARRRLPVHEVVRIAGEAAKGLAHAHERGLVHRDVKPANLMFDGEGHVKVVDFGVAIPAQRQVFVATEIVGTLHYMAPEQIDGLPLDARTDQYALGATLFQLLCGRLPFEKKRSVDVLYAHVNEAPPRPRELREDVPEWLERIVLKLLSKDRVDRFESLKTFGQALDEGEGAKVAPAEPPRAAKPAIKLEEITDFETGSRRIERPASPRRAWIAVAASVAAAVLFLVGPAREAVLSRAEAQPRELAVVVQDVLAETEAQAKATDDDPARLEALIARLDQEAQDLAGAPGAGKLESARASLAARLDGVERKAAGELEGRVLALLEKKRYAAAIDAAVPGSGSSPQRRVATTARDLAARARGELARARGEVYVPAGELRHGSVGERVRLAGFYLDRTEVTNADWEKAVQEHGLEAPPSWPGGKLDPALAKRPVTDVTFEAAGRYARALGKRLPTSLEWERAARGDDARAWPWGEVFERGRANLADGGSGALEDVEAREGDASPCGALGLAGNALEWVAGEAGPLVAGGGYRSQASSARAWARLALAPGARHPAVGFRCARDLEAD